MRVYTTDSATPVMDEILARQEDERTNRVHRQLKEQDEKRYANPDPTDPDLARVWVAYKWNGYVWLLAGFIRRRKRRRPQSMGRFFARVRRRLQIDKSMQVRLMDLGQAQRRAKAVDKVWMFEPPQRVQTTRPVQPIVSVVPKRPKGRITRYRKSVAPVFHKRETTFVALGRNPWDRAPEFLYLGPLEAESATKAMAEASRTFSAYKQIEVVPRDALSKRLRNAMHRGRTVRPGVTRILWPEPVLTKALLEMPASEVRSVSKRDVLLLAGDTERRLRKLAKSKKDRDTKIEEALALLSFVYSLPTYPTE